MSQTTAVGKKLPFGIGDKVLHRRSNVMVCIRSLDDGCVHFNGELAGFVAMDSWMEVLGDATIGLMNAKQFDVISQLIRARAENPDPEKASPVRLAARRVLIDGWSKTKAANEFGLSLASVNNCVARFSKAHAVILKGYKA